MTFETIPMLICFSALSATVFELFRWIYHMIFWKDYVSRKALLRRIDKLIKEADETIKSPTAYPTTKQNAMSRSVTLTWVRTFIEKL